MASAFEISVAAQQAACDAIVDLIDGGAGAGTIQIRTGAPPATPATADSGTLLGTLTFSDPAFGSANSSGTVALPTYTGTAGLTVGAATLVAGGNVTRTYLATASLVVASTTFAAVVDYVPPPQPPPVVVLLSTAYETVITSASTLGRRVHRRHHARRRALVACAEVRRCRRNAVAV